MIGCTFCYEFHCHSYLMMLAVISAHVVFVVIVSSTVIIIIIATSIVIVFTLGALSVKTGYGNDRFE